MSGRPIRSVAVLGLGLMGRPMARRLMQAGLEVRVYNRTQSRAEELASEGAIAAASPAQAARGADAALTMLSDGTAVEAVLHGEQGALAALGEGGLLLQMSTVGLAAARRLDALAADAGVVHVDAPVLGTRQPAEQGQLLVLASGPPDARDRCAPVFDAVGRRTLWLGQAGAGSALKVVLNNWIVSLVAALGETIALAEGIGVDPRRFLEAIAGGPLGLPYAQLKGEMMLEERYEPSFSLANARKDAGLVLEAAGEAGVTMAVTRAVAEQFEHALAAGHGGDDLAACVVAARAG